MPRINPTRRPLASGLGSLLALLLGACGKAAPAPNLLLISIDTLRADHLGCYGYERATSPRLDALAAEGVRYERCQSSTSWTLPAHLSMLTGQAISVHGIDDDRRWELTDENGESVPPLLRGRFLSEALQDEGYRCAGFYTWKYLEDRFGFGPGFETWERLGHTFYSHPEVAPEFERLRVAGDTEGLQALAKAHPTLFDVAHNTSPEVVERASAWLDEHSTRDTDQPFFLFAHFFDVHDPYVSPEPYHSQFDPEYAGAIDGMRVTSPDSLVRADMDARDLHNLVARYDGGIRYVDDQVGQLLDKLDALGLAENTLVVVTSDHGEEFFEHGHKTHRRQLHAESIEVPLILRWPAQLPAGRVVSGSAGLVDIAPTLLAAAGTSLGHACAGRDLLPSAKGAQLERHEYLSELLLFDRGQIPLRQFAWHDERGATTLGQTRGQAPWQWQSSDGTPIPRDSPAGRLLSPRWRALLNRYRTLGTAIPARALSATPLSPTELAELAAMGYGGGDEDGPPTTKATRRLSIEGGPWLD